MSDKFTKAAELTDQIAKLHHHHAHLLRELSHSSAIQKLWPDVFNVCKQGGKVTSGVVTKNDRITCLKVRQWNEQGHHVETRTFQAAEVPAELLLSYGKAA